MTKIYFHEDDFCQIELIPVDNFEFVKKQTKDIDNFSNNHKVGIGYDEIYIRNENPGSIQSLNLKLQNIKNILKDDIKMYKSVYTGYANYKKILNNTIAFGNKNKVILFIQFNKNNIIENMWLTLDIFSLNDKKLALLIFNKLALKYNLLLVDWGWSFYTTLSDLDDISNYQSKRLEVFTQSQNHFKNSGKKWW